MKRRSQTVFLRYRDRLAPTIENPADPEQLARFIRTLGPSNSELASWVAELSGKFINHEFNLLGTGWASHNAYRKPVLNSVNRTAGSAFESLLSPDYSPIAWQTDQRSLFAWPPNVVSSKLKVGKGPEEVKYPWELARLQHLVILSFRYSDLDPDQTENSDERAKIVAEFQNQVVDFVVSNPPRFGANWMSTSNVAIRCANILVAFDALRAGGANFSQEFRDLLQTSVVAHVRHIYRNFEYSSTVTTSRYLANIAGLLIATAYLPQCTENDTWLAFCVRQLNNEVFKQFRPDGGFHEASVCNHRFALEAVLWSVSFVVGLSHERRQGLIQYCSRPMRGFETARDMNFPKVDFETPRVFAKEFFDRLEASFEFVDHMRDSTGLAWQVGDNDSGFFIRPEAELYSKNASVVAEQEKMSFDYSYLIDTRSALGGGRSISRTAEILTSVAGTSLFDASANRDDRRKKRSRSFPDFGAYVLRSNKWEVLFRCGDVGQCGVGGHAHNDALSVAISYGGIRWVVDPGTYLLTSDVELRNYFRSSRMHSTLSVDSAEQNLIVDTFRMDEQANARIDWSTERELEGVHFGFSVPHHRRVGISEDGVRVSDECHVEAKKTVSWILHPDVQAEIIDGGGVVALSRGPVKLKLQGTGAKFSIDEECYSPSYGTRFETFAVRAEMAAAEFSWTLRESR